MFKCGLCLGVVLALCSAQISTPEPRTAWPFGKKELLTDIPLVWKPTTELGGIPPINTANLAGKRLQLVPFDDARENKELIGENREDADDGEILPVSTKDDVAAFVTDRFRYLLRYYGLDTESEPGDLIISGDVRSFLVAEDNTYEGDVALKVRVTDGSGTVLWEGVVAGTEARWGRSYNKHNYYETLSDSLVNAVNQLLSTSGFLESLGARPGQ